MNTIEKKFNCLKKNKKKGFIAYITAGDPTLKVTEELLLAFGNSGVDIVELGIPFSDPLADGPTNQRAAQRALKSGASVKKILAMVGRARKKTDIPIVFFTYLNPIFKYGLKKFAKDAKAAGVDGILILDMPAEESDQTRKIMNNQGISMVSLIAPTSTKDRIKLITKHASGFIYYVSRTGVTGERDSMEKGLKAQVSLIKKYTKIPVAVGFGISNPKQVREVSRCSDAVVVGSAIVNRIEENIGDSKLVAKVSRFVKTLTRAL